MGNSNKLNTLNYEIERWGTEKIDQESIKKQKVSKFGSFFEELLFVRLALVRKMVVAIITRIQPGLIKSASQKHIPRSLFPATV